jgi:sulfatase maturation enzyme AslB (radical SAM superfamily)
MDTRSDGPAAGEASRLFVKPFRHPGRGRKDGTAAGLPAIDRLLLVLTNRCNLRCVYCFQSASGNLCMSWDYLRTGIELALKEAAPRIEITFSGGEPLLEFDHIRKAVAHVRELRPPQTHVHYWLITNGLLLTSDKADFLREHQFHVQLSFDGIAAAQEYRGSHTFEILDRLLDSLQTKQPDLFRHRLRVAMTVVPPTVRHIASSVEYFITKGIPEISIAPGTTHYPGWAAGDISELDTQIAKVSDIIRRHLERTGEVPVKIFRKAPEGSFPMQRTHRPCRGLRGSALVIDADGRAYGCPFFAESYQEFPADSLMGNLKALRLGDIGDPVFPERRAAALQAAGLLAPPGWEARCYSSYGTCGDCQYRAGCVICPVSIWSKPDDPDPLRVPDFICAFNRVVLKYRERFPCMPGILDGLFPIR